MFVSKHDREGEGWARVCSVDSSLIPFPYKLLFNNVLL